MKHIPIATEINKCKILSFDDSTKSYLVECTKCHTQYTKTEYQVFDIKDKCACLKIKFKPKPTPSEQIVNLVYKTYRTSAKERSLTFKLSKEMVKNLIFSPCHWCMDAPSNMAKRTGHSVYGGIDRLDSSTGYIPENCVPCCWVCNNMKGTLGVDEFLSQCQTITRLHCQ